MDWNSRDDWRPHRPYSMWEDLCDILVTWSGMALMFCGAIIMVMVACVAILFAFLVRAAPYIVAGAVIYWIVT